MVVTAQDLRNAGIEIPLFVGGAALTRKFTATRIAPEYGGLTLYARDAMDGLDLANRLFSAGTREALVARIGREQAAFSASDAVSNASTADRPVSRSAHPRLAPAEVMRPPDYEAHVLRDVPLAHVFPYLNLQMLLGKHLGLRGLVGRLIEGGDARALELRALVDDLQRDAVARGRPATF
jgi:5-methyltetrahydrofolate--homocysteine methyltransferase